MSTILIGWSLPIIFWRRLPVFSSSSWTSFSFLYGRIGYSFRVSDVINGLSINRTFFDNHHQETVSFACLSPSPSLSSCYLFNYFYTVLYTFTSLPALSYRSIDRPWLTQQPGGTHFRRGIATFTSPHILPPVLARQPPVNPPSPPSHPNTFCCVAVDPQSHSIVSDCFRVSRSLEGLRHPFS